MSLSISIVTPTFNSRRFLAFTIDSVLNQQYSNLEYVIVDGNSTDGTQDIIRQYESRLTHWQSEPDSGMYDALQKGFARTTGDIMGYLNSDDLHLPSTLATVNQIFTDLPEVDWITSTRPLLVNQAGSLVDVEIVGGFHRVAFMRGENMLTGHYRLNMIQQESTFWRRSLWEKAGSTMDRSLKLAGDFELWARFYQHSELIGVRALLAGFRWHGSQLSLQASDAYHREALRALKHHSGSPHNYLTANLRRINRVIPKRLKKPASWLQMCYKSQNATYDLNTGKWMLRHDYI